MIWLVVGLGSTCGRRCPDFAHPWWVDSPGVGDQVVPFWVGKDPGVVLIQALKVWFFGCVCRLNFSHPDRHLGTGRTSHTSYVTSALVFGQSLAFFGGIRRNLSTGRTFGVL